MLEKALSGIKETLAYEGYDLLAAERERGVIDVMIIAGPDACEECLVPTPVLREMIASELKENGIKFKTINLTIPPHIMNQ
ncbi:MAG: hypothetical protein QM368_08805 [Bacillota bacterium]|jgi:hypothetical protein|nr:hypothetical protein [Bacillota bacterium]HHU30165.1 hypothetical protein [Bacillota bacterium]